MNARVIVVAAPAPGAGKSTLSIYLARQLTLNQIPVLLFHEHDFAQVAVMARFREQWYLGHPNTIESCLEATRAFFAPWPKSGATWVLDALYPGFTWLLGQYTPAAVSSFADELAQILQPVRPLLVYLSGEPRAFMERAAARRGLEWSEAYAWYIGERNMDHYPGGPVRTFDDAIRLFEWRNEHSLDLLQRWPGETLMLDALQTPLDELKRAVLDHVGLEEKQEVDIPAERLQGYAGVYTPCEPDLRGRLLVSLADGHLHVKAHWEGACPLVAEGADTFRLEATEYTITFVADSAGTVEGLRCIRGKSEVLYRKTG